MSSTRSNLRFRTILSYSSAISLLVVVGAPAPGQSGVSVPERIGRPTLSRSKWAEVSGQTGTLGWRSSRARDRGFDVGDDRGRQGDLAGGAAPDPGRGLDSRGIVIAVGLWLKRQGLIGQGGRGEEVTAHFGAGRAITLSAGEGAVKSAPTNC